MTYTQETPLSSLTSTDHHISLRNRKRMDVTAVKAMERCALSSGSQRSHTSHRKGDGPGIHETTLEVSSPSCDHSALARKNSCQIRGNSLPIDL